MLRRPLPPLLRSADTLPPVKPCVAAAETPGATIHKDTFTGAISRRVLGCLGLGISIVWFLTVTQISSISIDFLSGANSCAIGLHFFLLAHPNKFGGGVCGHITKAKDGRAFEKLNFFIFKA